MINHLLVPLDGSTLAEAALPLAAMLAGRLDASVTLVHVIEPNAPAMVHGHRHLQKAAEAQAYLQGVAAQYLAGITTEIHVHVGGKASIARSIIAHEDELAPDLIVMCAHGSGGLRDALMGSVAQQVVAAGEVPVLVLKADDISREPGIQRVLAPVEGNDEHEAGLELAVDFARTFRAELQLLLVLPNSTTLSPRQRIASRLMPAATERMLELLREQAGEYIEARTTEFAGSGLAVTARILEGDPTTIIKQAIEQTTPDLVVMGTHGKTGMAAYGESSVATQLFAQIRVPLLLVPVHQKD
jgi:nucleotide-binding universal stress UspA family protein